MKEYLFVHNLFLGRVIVSCNRFNSFMCIPSVFRLLDAIIMWQLINRLSMSLCMYVCNHGSVQ